MSTFKVGRVYSKFGRESFICIRRHFGGVAGCLELVDMQQADRRVTADGTEAVYEVFTRTALTFACGTVPPVTETLGGVRRPDFCDHRYFGRVLANAGPNAGHVCCAGCGGRFPTPDPQPAGWPQGGAR